LAGTGQKEPIAYGAHHFVFGSNGPNLAADPPMSKKVVPRIATATGRSYRVMTNKPPRKHTVKITVYKKPANNQFKPSFSLQLLQVVRGSSMSLGHRTD
jgi:hypothetical protein